MFIRLELKNSLKRSAQPNFLEKYSKFLRKNINYGVFGITELVVWQHNTLNIQIVFKFNVLTWTCTCTTGPVPRYTEAEFYGSFLRYVSNLTLFMCFTFYLPFSLYVSHLILCVLLKWHFRGKIYIYWCWCRISKKQRQIRVQRTEYP